MLLGTIARVDKSNRWVYVKCAAFKTELWAHRSEVLLADVGEELVGRHVSFELHHSPRGLQAVNVTIED